MIGIDERSYSNLERFGTCLPDEVSVDFFDYSPAKNNSNICETLQGLEWLRRFPFLKNISLYASERNTSHTSGVVTKKDEGETTPPIRLPYIKHPTLSHNKVILPLGYAAPLKFPEGLQPAPPSYLYSALVVFHDGEWRFFDGDYASTGVFWDQLFKNFPNLSNKDKLLWGIIILKDKLPHPIAVSKQISFHLGYDDQPLPKFMNLSLSSLCNIRCTICGTQDAYKIQDIKGHIINTEFLLKIANVFFPYLDTIELNSFGEQLLYEDFSLLMEMLNKYGCQFMLQTNGTTWPDRKMEAILSGTGIVTFSIDAIGEIFESQRVGAKWNVVENNVRRILAKRDPERIKVGISPAITCKTLPCILDLCRWANHIGIDYVNLHYYDPIPNGVEKRPSLEEQNNLFHRLKKYIATENPNMLIKLEKQQLTWGGGKRSLPPAFNSTHKYPQLLDNGEFYLQYRCVLPSTMVQITPDEIFFPGCCRLFRRTLPCPTTDEEFFSLWFGKDLTRLRESLKFEPPHPPMVQECLKCVAEQYRQNLKY
ncbi:MAG: hypothetical protein K2J64_08885 [Desulfovibrio sp.]|nr:hypothetical protein [Desulfovibrio sp.]